LSNGGFTLGGVPASNLGLRMIGKSQRPVLPKTSDRTLAIPGRSGLWDFGAELGPRIINLEVAFVETNSATLQKKVSELAAFLVDAYGRPRTMELILENQPDRRYIVRYSGSLPIDRISGFGRFVIPLVAYDPFAHSLTSIDEVTWGSEEITFQNDFYTYGHEGGQQVIVVNGRDLNVIVSGPISIRPRIFISGVGTNVKFSANGKSMMIDSLDDSNWVIDGENFKVQKDGSNALHHTIGDFIELHYGDNQVAITGTGMNFEMQFSFYDKFL